MFVNDSDGLLVSIVMPAYNAEKTMAYAIERVRDQLLEKWELIIVNDASTDATASIGQAYAAQDKRITLISLDKNQGQSVARNTGLAVARGEWVAFLDADDSYTPKRLQTMLAYASSLGLNMIADNQFF